MKRAGRKRRTTTLDDVARHAGVSKSTVSGVLNRSRSNTRVSEETAGRIRQAAEDLEYHPNAIARGLAHGHMNTLGIVVAGDNVDLIQNAYHGGVIAGILNVAFRRDQFATLFYGTDWGGQVQRVSLFCDGRTDGLLLLAPNRPVLVDTLLRARTPFVLIGEQSDDPSVTSVDIDNQAATVLMTLLLDRGHRRIAMIHGPDLPASPMRRLGVYRQALSGCGILFDERYVIETLWTEEALGPPLRSLMALPVEERPTAFFCFNDKVALLVMRLLRELGLRVPADVSVTGFDDIAEAEENDLTTMRQDPFAIGVRAAELLLGQIQEGVAPGRKELLPTEVVVRGSVGPAPG